MINKTIFILSAILATGGIQSMQRSIQRKVYDLNTTKQDRVAIFKKTCKNALAKIESSYIYEKCKNKMLIALDTYSDCLTDDEIIKYSKVLYGDNGYALCYLFLVNQLDKFFFNELPNRYKIEKEWRHKSLKNECLYKLKNISVRNFKKLPRTLQRALIEKYNRIDLAYAYATNNTVSPQIAQLITSLLNEEIAQKIGHEQEINRIFPQSILQHGNNILYADALMHSN